VESTLAKVILAALSSPALVPAPSNTESSPLARVALWLPTLVQSRNSVVVERLIRLLS
jgi:hypothetical protein